MTVDETVHVDDESPGDAQIQRPSMESSSHMHLLRTLENGQETADNRFTRGSDNQLTICESSFGRKKGGLRGFKETMIALRTLLLLSLLVGCRAQQTCLQTNMELRDAVADYVASGGSPDSASAMTYGHPIGTWCVGELDDFSFAFAFQDFNEPLDGWDVSNATSLDYMFFNSITFNQDISGWTVERVETMKGMVRLGRASHEIYASDSHHCSDSLIVQNPSTKICPHGAQRVAVRPAFS